MTKQFEPVKLGIIGLGRAGWGMHCKEIRNKQEQFRIVAGCDPIGSRMRLLSEEFGSKSYERVEDLVNDEDVELVDIASRSCDHYAQAMLALEAGKDVLIEKPMTMHLHEAKLLVEEAAHKGKNIYVRQNRRYDLDFLHVSEIIDSGILGEVFSIKLSRHSYQRRNDWQTIKEFGGGQLLNWGPHIIDHALHLLQSPVKSMWSHLDQITAAGNAEDHVKIILTGENKRMVEVEISGGVTLPAPMYQIYGDRGALTLSGKEIKLKYLHPDVQLKSIEADPGTPGQSFGKSGTFKEADELKWVEECLQVSPIHSIDFWEDLYRSIRFKEPFRIKTSEALRVMEVISRVKQDTPFL